MRKLFLGIDGGGTKTAVCLLDENKNIIAQAQSGPSSYDTVTQEVFKANILDALSKLTYEGEIVSVFAGLGGICNENDANVVRNTLLMIEVLKKFPKNKPVMIMGWYSIVETDEPEDINTICYLKEI